MRRRNNGFLINNQKCEILYAGEFRPHIFLSWEEKMERENSKAAVQDGKKGVERSEVGQKGRYPGWHESRRVVIIGCGKVGMSYAYAMLNQSLCDELVLIDSDREKAEGEAMDLSHGLAFSGNNMQIKTGTYEDCAEADIVMIAAGVGQAPGEKRTELMHRNTAIFAEIVEKVVGSGFGGIFLVATNPVDIMTKVVYKLSGFSRYRVIGSGTTLDTARLRYLLGSYFTIDPRNVHAYVIGEHGDSEFVPWSQALIGTKPVLNVCDDSLGRYRYEDLVAVSDEVRDAAYRIIAAKGATSYGIGMALTRITRAIFGNEHSVLTVSSLLNGEYGQDGIYVGSPTIINRGGIVSTVRLSLNDYELKSFHHSCEVLRELYSETGLE